MKFLDMHTDTASAMLEKGVGLNKNHLHMDLERSGHDFFYLPFLTMFANSARHNMQGLYRKMRDNLDREMENRAVFVTTCQALEEALARSLRPALFAVEGAELFDCDTELLEKLKNEDSLLMTGIAWNNPNALIEPDRLSLQGRRFTEKCRELGIVVDVSHLGDRQTREVLSLTDRAVASHSNARSLCGVGRNLPDELIRAIGDVNGLIGMNLYTEFIAAQKEAQTIDRLARHAAYIADKIGHTHVALGSNFDGAQMPDGITGVEDLPKLITALESVGFSQHEIEDITFNNACRYFLGSLPKKGIEQYGV